jgi:hypothetical protein
VLAPLENGAAFTHVNPMTVTAVVLAAMLLLH